MDRPPLTTGVSWAVAGIARQDQDCGAGPGAWRWFLKCGAGPGTAGAEWSGHRAGVGLHVAPLGRTHLGLAQQSKGH